MNSVMHKKYKHVNMYFLHELKKSKYLKGCIIKSVNECIKDHYFRWMKVNGTKKVLIKI